MIASEATSGAFKLLKLRQVMGITGLACSTVYKYCAKNNFPRPVQLGKRNVAWVEGEVQRWIEQKIHQRDMAS
ncbi:AlpA family transcriptional regulator [uncultured Amphritea sp.]|uniref:helix-turn-helix transcriptional regulator n=1 Tax=uncultured Amphritea sp. TaxID=981605 RepID=UPI00261BD044|nr:AlpA family transcriptional regulator [uncultured Amphritea sp.]